MKRSSYVEYNHSQHMMIVRNQDHVSVRNSKNGELVFDFSSKEMKGSYVEGLFLDDQLMIITMREGWSKPLKVVKVVNVNTKQEVKDIFPPKELQGKEIWSIASSLQSHQIAVGLSNEIRIFTLNSLQQVYTLSQRYDVPNFKTEKIYFSLDGKYLIIPSLIKYIPYFQEKLIAPIMEWNISTGEVIMPYGCDLKKIELVRFVVYSPDGKGIVGTSDKGQMMEWLTPQR